MSCKTASVAVVERFVSVLAYGGLDAGLARRVDDDECGCGAVGRARGKSGGRRRQEIPKQIGAREPSALRVERRRLAARRELAQDLTHGTALLKRVRGGRGGDRSEDVVAARRAAGRRRDVSIVSAVIVGSILEVIRDHIAGSRGNTERRSRHQEKRADDVLAIDVQCWSAAGGA